MKLTTKKFVFAGLCILTIGGCVGGVWVPELFAIAGTALVGTIAVGRIIIKAPGADNATQTPEDTPVPAPGELTRVRRSTSPSAPTNSPTLPVPSNLSPPKVAAVDLSKMTSPSSHLDASPTPPQLARDFSMHISYKPEFNVDGSISPNAINVSVHSRSPNSPPRNVSSPTTPQAPTPREMSAQENLVALASPQSPGNEGIGRRVSEESKMRSPNWTPRHLKSLKKGSPKVTRPRG